MISDETTHRYRVMDIARSAEGTTYMATDSSNGVVVLHKNRQWTFNNFLPKSKIGGTPTAVALIEAPSPRLVVAVTSGWCKWKKTKIVVFDLVQRKLEKSLTT
ncbi:hypothetical protein DPMN_121011 [Dreissena polymorpha]|uniref:Uncharacterized protein n=1 Tax=Dreissena polymorpha TaxID=45954 RepID=A0A9D4JT77_DREPO|nr:hypothetical protein DPMN_121011 [Dreissena polymorpha]